MEYAKQHYVPISYLKPWCDPSVTERETEFLWVSSINGQHVFRKALKNIFSGKDFYTVYDNRGKRILDWEQFFHRVEDGYLKARDTIIKHGDITIENFAALVLFVITLYARTKHQKKEQSIIWDDLLSIYQTRDLQKASPFAYNQIEHLRDQPLPFHIGNFVRKVFPVVKLMNLTVLEITGAYGFITSDCPVLWLDPSLLLANQPLSFFGLKSSSLEIYLPISPYHVVKLSKSGPEGYTYVGDNPQTVDAINSLLVQFGDEYVISNSKNFNPQWFGMGN